MAKRSRAVRPDLAYMTEDGRTIGVVSEAALQEEVAAAVTVCMFSGGMFSVVLHRHPTGVPNEMVTVGALISWQDRDDAKPQPEPAAPAREVEPEPQEDLEEHYRAGQPGEPVLEPDGSTGWDPTPEELEDRLTDEEDAALPATEDLPIAEAVVVGAPVGAVPGVLSVEEGLAAVRAAETRAARESGEGSGALPFQRGATDSTPRPEVDLSQVVHGDAASLPRGAAAPAPAGSSEGISDGLDEASLPEEDDSSIPESRR